MMTQKLVTWTRIAAICVFGALLAQAEQESDPKPKQPTIRNFSLPEYNEQMELVSKIEGDSATAVDNRGTFDISHLRYEMFRDGKVDARVTAPSCTYSKRTNEGWSKGKIRITRDELVVTGENFKFNGKKEKIFIGKNAKVVLRSVNVRIWGENDE